MSRDEDIARALRQRDVDAISELMFGGQPMPRTGFRTETELWDYKSDCPRPGRLESVAAWASIAVDVLAFYNNRGGVLVFGVTDNFSFSGATCRLDSKLFNEQLRRYLTDRIWVEFHREFIQSNQRYLGLAIIPPRGPAIERFSKPGPLVAGRRLFDVGFSAIREGDSSRILSVEQAAALARQLAIPTVGAAYAIDEPFFRLLSPDYSSFVFRAAPCKEVEDALSDRRAAVTSIIGIGGVGKTALATWAFRRAYERRDFELIASITAKDRELTVTGLRALAPALTNFETLLDNVLEIAGLPDLRRESAETKEAEVRALLKGTRALLYVDNLETVDDPRIVRYLDTLPDSVRAIVTSRRTTVRTSVHPVDLGPLTDDEIDLFVTALGNEKAFAHVTGLSRPERLRIGRACDGIPLAIRWALARARSPQEAIVVADGITGSGNRGEELLEFCFRRVFENMAGPERAVLEVLALFQRPVPTEAVLVGARLPHFKLLDAAEELVADALVQRYFDPDRNDYAYGLLPVARAFVYSQVRKQGDLEERIRRTLGDWFEAKDVRDPGERLVVRGLRQGQQGADTAVLDLAQAAARRGDLRGAQELFEQALRRNPRSWRAARAFAEFQRHKLRNTSEAILLYEQAAANAPLRGTDRALIFREWGMLLRDSGDPSSTDLAIEKFEEAVRETPDDVLAIHGLAHMLDRKGSYRRVAELLGPLADHPNSTTRRKTVPLLIRAYEQLGDRERAVLLRIQQGADRD